MDYKQFHDEIALTLVKNGKSIESALLDSKTALQMREQNLYSDTRMIKEFIDEQALRFPKFKFHKFQTPFGISCMIVEPDMIKEYSDWLKNQLSFNNLSL